MFEALSEQLSQTLRSLTGKAKLTEDNIQDALRDVRRALLEADVALPVVRDFTDRVKLRALGQEVGKSLSPGQACQQQDAKIGGALVMVVRRFVTRQHPLLQPGARCIKY